MPSSFKRIADYEQQFGKTIHRTRTVQQQAERGTPYACEQKWLAVAESVSFDEPILVENWTLPKGAFGESAGPL